MYGLGDLRVQFALGCKYVKDIYIEELSGHHPTMVLKYIPIEIIQDEDILKLEDEPINIVTVDGDIIFCCICN